MEQADRKTIKKKMVILSNNMDFVSVTPALLARDIFENHHIEKFDVSWMSYVHNIHFTNQTQIGNSWHIFQGSPPIFSV